MCAASLILLAALDLGTLFSSKEAWTGKAEFFAVEHTKDGFVFASENRTIVNCLRHDTLSGPMPTMLGTYVTPGLPGDEVWSTFFDRLPHLGFRLCIGPKLSRP